MRLVREDFARITRPATDPDHRAYVALSYVWGTSEWTEHRDPEGTKKFYVAIMLFLLEGGFGFESFGTRSIYSQL